MAMTPEEKAKALKFLKESRGPITSDTLAQEQLDPFTRGLIRITDPTGERAAQEAQSWKEGKRPGGFWEQLGVGGYNALNQFGMGLPDLLVNKIGGSDAYKRLQETRLRNPMASRIGDVAGTTGSLVVPTGSILTGAGKLVGAGGKALPVLGKIGKGLETAGDIASGAKAVQGLKGALGKGFLTAAEQTVPRFLTEAGTTGDIKKAGETALLNTAVGTGLGALLSSVGQKLPQTTEAAREELNDIVNYAGGIRTRGLSRSLGGTASGKTAGGIINKVDDLKDELADIISKRGFDKASAKAMIGEGAQAWKAIDTAYSASGIKPSQLKPLIQASGLFQEVTDEIGENGQRVLDDLLSVADKKKDLPSIRKLLQEKIDRAYKTGDEGAAQIGKVAKAIRDTIDEKFVPAELKAQYPALKAVKESLAQTERVVAPGVTAGSTTSTQQLARNIALGAATGGATGIDLNDPESLKKAGIRALVGGAAGGVGGNILAKLANTAGNRAMGTIASGLRRIVPKAGSPIISKIGGVLQGIGAKAPQFVGAGGLQAVGNLATQITNPQSQDPTTETIETKETQTDPTTVQKAKDEINTAYQDRIINNLQEFYTAYDIGNEYGASFEDFASLMMRLTDNFDPKKAAAIVFPDPEERKSYLKSYDAALSMQGIETGKVFDPQKTGFMGWGGPDAASKMATDQLKSLMISALTKEGEAPDKNTVSFVENELKTISDLKISPEMKQKVLEDHLKTSYGIDLSQMRELGLYT